MEAPKAQLTKKSPDDPKTPLQHAHTLWVTLKKEKAEEGQEQDWESGIKPVSTFATIEDFWHVYQYIKRPSQLEAGTTLQVFMEGVKPMWEDPNFVEGGRFTLRVQKTHSNRFWEDLMLGFLGE